MNVTPWFAGMEKPVHSGLYQVKGAVPELILWCFWNADIGRWGFVSQTQEGAVGWRDRQSSNQNRRWRGITK